MLAAGVPARLSSTVGPFVLLAGVALLIQAIEPLQHALRLDRHAVLQGDWWRLLTGHVTHGGWLHVGGNLLTLGALYWLGLQRLAPAHQLALVLCSAIGVSAGLLLFTAVPWYGGLSGVLHGLAAALGVLMLYRRPGLAATLLLGMTMKLTTEGFLLDGSPALVGRLPVIHEAHLYGAISGVMGGSALLFRKRWGE